MTNYVTINRRCAVAKLFVSIEVTSLQIERGDMAGQERKRREVSSWKILTP